MYCLRRKEWDAAVFNPIREILEQPPSHCLELFGLVTCAQLSLRYLERLRQKSQDLLTTAGFTCARSSSISTRTPHAAQYH
jgi:hypothetical protein